MKKAIVILSGIILIAFFLLWSQINIPVSPGADGNESSIGQSVPETTSFAEKAISSPEFMSFFCIVLALGLGGIVYALTTRRENYTWFTLYLSAITFVISGSYLNLSQFSNTASGDSALNSTLFIPGIYIAFFSAILLGVLSLINNAKHFSEYKKTTIISLIISPLVAVVTIYYGAVAIISHPDPSTVSAGEQYHRISMGLISMAIGFCGVVIFLSTFLIFILGKIRFNHTKNHKCN